MRTGEDTIRRTGLGLMAPHSQRDSDLTSCHRCGGLMVREHCMDLLDSTGQLEFVAQRCVQCGDIVDPVILRNRALYRGARVRAGEPSHESPALAA